MTENEMVGWHHQLHKHDFEQAPGIGGGQGTVACCSPWGCKESDRTERLNWTEYTWTLKLSFSFKFFNLLSVMFLIIVLDILHLFQCRTSGLRCWYTLRQSKHELEKNFQTQRIQKGVSLLRTKSRDKVGTGSAVGWPADGPGKGDSFCGLIFLASRPRKFLLEGWL